MLLSQIFYLLSRRIDLKRKIKACFIHNLEYNLPQEYIFPGFSQNENSTNRTTLQLSVKQHYNITTSCKCYGIMIRLTACFCFSVFFFRVLQLTC